MTVTEVLSSRVEAGMTLLDSRRPGWPALVDPTRLNLESPYWCVLGQVYTPEMDGDAMLRSPYVIGARDLDLSIYEVDGADSVTAYGFSIADEMDGEPDVWETLAELWATAITARKSQAQ